MFMWKSAGEVVGDDSMEVLGRVQAVVSPSGIILVKAITISKSGVVGSL